MWIVFYPGRWRAWPEVAQPVLNPRLTPSPSPQPSPRRPSPHCHPEQLGEGLGPAHRVSAASCDGEAAADAPELRLLDSRPASPAHHCRLPLAPGGASAPAPGSCPLQFRSVDPGVPQTHQALPSFQPAPLKPLPRVMSLPRKWRGASLWSEPELA